MTKIWIYKKIELSIIRFGIIRNFRGEVRFENKRNLYFWHLWSSREIGRAKLGILFVRPIVIISPGVQIVERAQSLQKLKGRYLDILSSTQCIAERTG